MSDRKRAPERKLRDQIIRFERRAKRRPVAQVNYRALEQELRAA